MWSLLLICLASPLRAEMRTISLKEAVDLALKANPDLLLARMDEQRANLAISIAKDPFRPKVIAGSGLAYSNGFPMSIEGSAPSVVQARAIAAIFNRPASYRVAQTKEDARTAVIDSQIRREDIVLRTAVFFLDAARWVRTADSLRSQIGSLERAGETVRARVQEGRELELESKRAALSVSKTRHRAEAIELQKDQAETSLALILGFTAADRMRPVKGDLLLDLPDSEELAVSQALQNSREIRRLESAMMAKRLELQQHNSHRLPSVDLVAQYGLFARFNNYEDFFNRFQRHNGQLGVSVQVPLFSSAASLAQSAQVEVELNALRTRVNQTRNRISMETQSGYRQAKLSDRSREIARIDLELAREQVTVLLAQQEEGRATLRQIEEARFQEQEKWIAYFDSQFSSEKGRLELLRMTGSLLAALQ
ncbi:MAG TPA: TolC family protein [Bryobacteraceae bacterium]|nr:TolC family protein [Bryobacteraceae bacterium]